MIQEAMTWDEVTPQSLDGKVYHYRDKNNLECDVQRMGCWWFR